MTQDTDEWKDGFSAAVHLLNRSILDSLILNKLMHNKITFEYARELWKKTDDEELENLLLPKSEDKQD
ncbi:MAG: hypothetical protein LC687_02245 [Actinobacteria bacterium]|nr:hypothetical protein [Actinomycetota bacterium]